MARARLIDTEVDDDLRNAETLISRPATPIAKNELLLESLLGKMRLR